MNRWWFIVPIIVVVLIIVGILIFYDNPVPKNFRCGSDSDCVMVDVCCSCEEGGARVAVSFERKDFFLDELQDNCNDPNNVLCGGIPSTYDVCNDDVYAKCWDGWCSTSNLDPRQIIIVNSTN